MAEYIERKAVYNVIVNNYDADSQLRDLDAIPAADVVPVKHGAWDDKKVGFYLKCSECGCCVRSFVGVVFLDYAQEWNYCPNCGARMDGGEQ